MKLDLEHFTLNWEKKGKQYKIWFTNCDYRRGSFSKHFECKGHNVSFVSSGFPAWGYPNCYIPGTDKKRDNHRILAPLDDFENMLCIIKKKVPDDFGMKMLEKMIKTTRRAYIFLDRNFHTCKELALETIISRMGGVVIISETFTESQIKQLNKWQGKVPEKSRFKIENLGNAIKVTFPKWWLNYYRLGWALLAFRIVTKRESFSELSDDPKDLKEKFDAFVTGKFTIKNLAAWNGYNNWVENAIYYPENFR